MCVANRQKIANMCALCAKIYGLCGDTFQFI